MVRVTVDLGHPAPPGFYAKINSSASTAKFGHGLDRPSRPDWTMDGKVGIEEPYVARRPRAPQVPRPRPGGPCVESGIQNTCNRFISADDWNNRDWQRMHYLKDWNGASRKTFTIRIADDDYVDPGETIVLQGIGYIYATGIDHGGTGFAKGQVQSNELRLTIADNDGGAAADAPILLSAIPTIARESGTGADSTARMPVVLSRPATQKVTVHYATVSGTSTEGTDFEGFGTGATNPASTLTFEPGETRKEIEITIKDDNLEDSGEYFSVFLYDLTPASVVRFAPDLLARFRFTQVTIINDEADLEGLKLWGAPGAGGPFARLDLGAFDGAVSGLRGGRCRNGTTHAKLAGIAPQNEHLGLEAGRAGSTLTAVRRQRGGSGGRARGGRHGPGGAVDGLHGRAQDLPGDGDAARGAGRGRGVAVGHPEPGGRGLPGHGAGDAGNGAVGGGDDTADGDPGHVGGRGPRVSGVDCAPPPASRRPRARSRRARTPTGTTRRSRWRWGASLRA